MVRLHSDDEQLCFKSLGDAENPHRIILVARDDDLACPSDVLKQDIGKSVVESCVTQAYLANPRATRSDYVDGFKVSPEEFDLIKNLPEAGRTLLVKQGARSVLVKLDLEGFRDELVVLSGSIDNVELLDRIRAHHTP